MKKDIGEILRRIYKSEINIRIGWMYDGGLDYSIGTSYNMWFDNPSKIICTGNINIEEAIFEMACVIAKEFPKSEFTKWFLKKYKKNLETKPERDMKQIYFSKDLVNNNKGEECE